MSYQTNAITNIRTIKAMRGESLTIDLGKTFLGTLTAWMKRDPEDLTFRSFSIIDNRYLFLSQLKASDFIDGNGAVLEAVGGKWFFDVEQVLDGEDADTVETIFRGTIQFQNDITGSQGIEVTDPQVLIDNTFISHFDTPNAFGNYRQILQINITGDGLEFIDKTIVGFSGTKTQFNAALTNGTFMFTGDAPTAHSHSFSSLTGKPTTLLGYAISDTRENYNTSLSDGTFMFLNGAQEVQGVKSFADGTMFLLNQAKTFGGAFRNVNSANRLYTLQDKDGVVAHLDDIPDEFDSIEAYITDSATITKLNSEGNWDVNGLYTGPGITGTVQGQKHFNADYYFEATNDNIWLRLKRADIDSDAGASQLDELSDVGSALALDKHILIGDGFDFNTRQMVIDDLEDYPDQLEAYITSSTIKAQLNSTSNWNDANAYIGSPISGSFQGQKHFNSDFFFEAVDDNNWVRLKRAITTDDIIGLPEAIESYITDPVTIVKLNFVDNWDINSIYIGPAITGTQQGQNHFNTQYFFTATDDNQWLRLKRGDTVTTDDITDYPDEVEAYISNATTIINLNLTVNWDIDGVYIGTTITGTQQGQKHFNTAYFFEAIDDNLWVRFPRV